MPAASSQVQQAIRLPLQLRAIDHHDFPMVWPVIGSFYQTGPNRIVANVIPFLRVTFVAAQNVIKESRLPKTRLRTTTRVGFIFRQNEQN